jgi:hypothetical protein
MPGRRVNNAGAVIFAAVSVGLGLNVFGQSAQRSGPISAPSPSVRPPSVTVIGAVMDPCHIPLKPNQRLGVLEAIFKAGGPDPFSDHKMIYILRTTRDAGKVKVPVNLHAAEQNQNQDTLLQSGDIVVLPKKYWSY